MATPKAIKSVLISQPRPEGRSPYSVLTERYGISVDFRAFTEVQGLSVREFRRSHVELTDYTAIIFTSRNAADHYFRLCEEMRLRISQETKYFCINESIALYLQKYINYRKRKVFFPKNDRRATLEEVLKKHRKEEKFFLPCAANRKGELTDFMQTHNFNFAEAPMYETVASDLSDLKQADYDLFVFFSPSAVESFLKNFPDFQQGNTCIGAFGPATCQSIEQHGLRLDIKAPTPEAISISIAIERSVRENLGMSNEIIASPPPRALPDLLVPPSSSPK